MRILLLIDAMGLGGAETHVATLARGLALAGHEVSVISEGGALDKTLAQGGVRVLHFPRRIRGPFFSLSLSSLVGYLRALQATEHFDVMHAHTRRCALLLGLLRATRRWRPSRFLSVPCAFSQDPPPYRKKSLLQMSFPLLVVTAHARFDGRYRSLSFWGDATIAVSEDLARHARDTFGVPASRIQVIPNGIDTRVFCLSEQHDAEEKKPSPLRVTFASRLDEDCSAAAYLLLSLFPQWQALAERGGQALQLTLLGGGSCQRELARLANELNRRYQKEGEPPPVSVPGGTDEPARLFQTTDIFVGVSRAALEAIGCGATVILAGNEGFGGVLTEHNFDSLSAENFCCRTSPALSEQGLTQAFCQLLALLPTQRSALARSLRRRVEQDYSAQRMVQRTEEIYCRTLQSRRRLRLLVGGYAGCGNLGDDAILRRLVARWQGRLAPTTPIDNNNPSDPTAKTSQPRLQMVALTGGGKRDEEQFGVACVDRKNVLAVWRAAGRADAFVLGGGALLQNCSSHGARSLLYYLSLLFLMRLRNCPVYLVANGIGPLKGGFFQWLVCLALRRANGISVRDEASLRLLGQIGVDTTRVGREDDPVLSLRPLTDYQTQWHWLDRTLPAVHRESFVCIVPRESDWLCPDHLADALRRICQSQGVYPLFFAFDAVRDEAVCRRLIEHVGFGSLCPPLDENAVAALFSASLGVISMRLHGLILAKTVQARALCIPYSKDDPKLIEFASRAGQDVLTLPACQEQLLQCIARLINKTRAEQ